MPAIKKKKDQEHKRTDFKSSVGVVMNLGCQGDIWVEILDIGGLKVRPGGPEMRSSRVKMRL